MDAIFVKLGKLGWWVVDFGGVVGGCHCDETTRRIEAANKWVSGKRYN